MKTHFQNPGGRVRHLAGALSGAGIALALAASMSAVAADAEAKADKQDKQEEQPDKAAESTAVPWLGVATRATGPALAAQLGIGADDGITVITVVPDSPAAMAGIEDFDVMVEFDGVTVESPQMLSELVRGKRPGDVVGIGLLRKGERLGVEATLGERERAVASGGSNADPNRSASNPLSRPRDPFGDDFPNSPLFQGFGNFGSMGDIAEHLERIREQMESRFESMMRTDPFSNSDNSASTFMQMKNSTMSFSDDSGTVTITRRNGKTHVEARDAEDNVIYEGPANTEDERAKMPDALREKVEKFENSRVDFGAFDQFHLEPQGSSDLRLRPDARRKSELKADDAPEADEAAGESPESDGAEVNDETMPADGEA